MHQESLQNCIHDKRVFLYYSLPTSIVLFAAGIFLIEDCSSPMNLRKSTNTSSTLSCMCSKNGEISRFRASSNHLNQKSLFIVLRSKRTTSVIPTDTKASFSPLLFPSSILILCKEFFNSFLNCKLVNGIQQRKGVFFYNIRIDHQRMCSDNVVRLLNIMRLFSTHCTPLFDFVLSRNQKCDSNQNIKQKTLTDLQVNERLFFV